MPWSLRHIRCADDETWSDSRQGLFKFPPSNLRGHGTLPPTAFPFSMETTFHLPADSETLFLLSRGPKLGGGVEIVTSPSLDDVVEVQINARYLRKDLLDRTSVCLSERGEGEYGISMLSSPRWQRPGHEDNVYFHVTVVLPQGASSRPLVVNNLETNMPNFFHNIGQLGEVVQFKQLSLNGLDAPIQVQSLTAESARIRTTNGLISGTFMVSSSLSLRTSNAPIDTLITLDDNDTTVDSTVHIQTSNGELKSTVHIDPSTNLNLFTLNAKTSNAPLEISVPYAPSALPFFLTAKTSNAPASVSIPPTFSGPFQMKTSNEEQYVDQRNPPIQGRQIHVYKTLGRATHGIVKWLDERPDGNVAVRTSNAPVTLML
ncbi:hypothetical protein BDN72DRAFT_759463 [Pluteus cervinus]|uniref:Uncharacterized protein n=1 Tax=Pluteus cervinus TaxID=181527 RepID=A0ACD3BAH9_9AGAR|nr:hypothetical protein BDN72DRAFT_759463 [Pluteus cervinus]